FNNLFIKFRNILFNKFSILSFVLIIFILYFFFGFEITLAFFILISMMFFLGIYYPNMGENKKYEDITQELPYALRHMATDLKSGKGLHDTLLTISKTDYGSLSQEFKRVLEEIKYGESTESALFNMSKRVKSKGLSRAIQQIIATLHIGGNLATSLNIIAEDISFDMQIQLKEYSQKLNGFILIYTFLAILAPVILLIMIMAASTVMGDIIPSEVLLILYIFFFPMIVIFMGIFIKRLEPSI
ncbi:type II secretion system F family protein, partial [Methanobrevibacter sp. OttesenSCG-928-I08]|nr:type II secretion system F family protein [Methanobrevibacter sp. OttesenSCG-928-I08]